MPRCEDRDRFLAAELLIAFCSVRAGSTGNTGNYWRAYWEMGMSWTHDNFEPSFPQSVIECTKPPRLRIEEAWKDVGINLLSFVGTKGC